MPTYKLRVEYHVTRVHEFEADDEDDADNIKHELMADDQYDLGYDVDIWNSSLEEID